MTGKAYYLTTLADWQRHAPRFANSHFIILDAAPSAPTPGVRHSERSDRTDVVRPGHAGTSDRAVEESLFHSVPDQEFAPKNDAPQAPSDAQLHPQHVFEVRSDANRKIDNNADLRILVLIEADEGVHLSLEDEPAFESLPHPLAQRPVSDAVQAALAPHGVAPGATTFDAAEALARIHPLLKHRVF
jgi:hypothetical protein